MISFKDQLHPAWRQALGVKVDLLSEIEEKLVGEDYLPSGQFVLRALSYDPQISKVLILGQDPYPNRIDAMGLAFATARDDGKFPASLKNIFKEFSSDLQVPVPETGDLRPWSTQGVVLLNRTLTCRVGESDSHKDLGWREFTEEVIKILAQQGVIAILWGKSAQELARYFPKLSCISSAHPSPLSAYKGFFGSKPFSRVNEALIASNREPINWTLINK